MPGINGMQATQAIKSGTGPNTTTPIIPVTAHALPDEREEFSASGMQGFIQKPVDSHVLTATLGAILDGQKRAPDPDDPAPLPQPAPAENLYLDHTQISELIELLGRDKLSERISMLVSKMDDELPALTEAAGTEELRERSHAVAGMCGMFGASRLHSILEEIETACKTGQEREARAMVELLPDVWEATQQAWRHKVLQ